MELLLRVFIICVTLAGYLLESTAMGGADHTFDHLHHKMSNFSVSVYHNSNGKLKEHDPLSICLDPSYKDMKCSMAIVKIGRYNPESIASVLNHIDSKRHFIATLHVYFVLESESEIQYGNTIDAIIQPRPWWQIRDEKIFERDHHDPNHPPADHATIHTSLLILDRIHHTLDTFMKFLAATHYQNPTDCDNTPISIRSNGMVHPGWGSHFGFMNTLHAAIPYAIQTLYFPRHSQDRNAFFSLREGVSECNKTNMWDCAFISTTNCSLEGLVFNSKNYGEELLKKSAQKYGSYCLIYKSRNSGALCNEDRIYNHSGDCGENPNYSTHSRLFKELWANYSEVKPKIPHVEAFDKKNLVVDPNPKYSSSLSLFNGYTLDDQRRTSYIFDWFVRPSYLYRRRIQANLKKFYEEAQPSFNEFSTCVATHIRRGDRVALVDRGYGEKADKANNEYIIELCNNVTMRKGDNISCRWPNGRFTYGPVYCYFHDLGCESYPLSMVTLEMIIEKAGYLVDQGNGTKNLVVATDDPDWLKFHMKRLKKTHPEWNLYIIKEPENHLAPDFNKWLSTMNEPYSNYHNMRSDGGSESGAYMFSSLKLMQQCSGFVGHFDSHFSFIIMNLLCLKNSGNSRNQCPPFYDFRLNKYPKFLKDKYY